MEKTEGTQRLRIPLSAFQATRREVLFNQRDGYRRKRRDAKRLKEYQSNTGAVRDCRTLNFFVSNCGAKIIKNAAAVVVVYEDLLLERVKTPMYYLLKIQGFVPCANRQ